MERGGLCLWAWPKSPDRDYTTSRRLGRSSTAPGRSQPHPACPHGGGAADPARRRSALGVGSALVAAGWMLGTHRGEPRRGRGLEQGAERPNWWAGRPRPAPAPTALPRCPGSNLPLRFLLAAPPRSSPAQPNRASLPPAGARRRQTGGLTRGPGDQRAAARAARSR